MNTKQIRLTTTASTIVNTNTTSTRKRDRMGWYVLDRSDTG
jgi:hypothetical protein